MSGAAGAARVSLSEGERLAQEGGVAAPTMLDLFVSGYDDVTFEEDPLNPGQEVINTKMSYRQSQAAEPGADGPQYVPDPPCIMPFEESEDQKAIFEQKAVNPALPDYWKSYAGWLEYWPGIKEHRKWMEEFRNLWQNKSQTSRMRAFVNISKNSIGVRFGAEWAEEDKNGQIIAPGQCVAIENIEEKEGTRFLKLPGPGAGWIFENTEDGRQVMAEMRNIEVGFWWYRMCFEQPVEIRKSPDFTDESRSSWIMAPKELAVVDIRVKIAGYNFFHLYDGRGWIFEKKPGTMKNDKNSANTVMTQCDDEFIEGEDAMILKNLVPPTNEVVEVGMWTYIVNMQPVLAVGSKRNGHFVTPGAVLKVDKRANSNGNPPSWGGQTMQNRMWLRLADGNGWVPERDEVGKKLMLLQASDEVAYPSWFKPGADPNKKMEGWHSGVV